MSVHDRNYYLDPRVLAKNQNGLAICVTVIDDDGSEVTYDLPTKWEVCHICNGEGKHVNPAIDAGGLSAEDFAEDPDLAENYFSGAYDVPCNGCGGMRVQKVVDEVKCDPALLEEYYRQEQENRDIDLAAANELMMGA